MRGYKPRGGLSRAIMLKSAAYQAIVVDVRLRLEASYRNNAIETELYSIRHNYAVMRKIIERWRPRFLVFCFDSWVGWTRNRIKQRKWLKQRAIKRFQVEDEARIARQKLQDSERDKWIKKRDRWEDRVYYEHAETGETNWTEPVQNKDFVYQRHLLKPHMKQVHQAETTAYAAV